MVRQIATLVWVKYRILLNSRGGPSAAMNLFATMVSGAFYLLLSFGFASVVFALARHTLSRSETEYEWLLAKALLLLVAYWVVSPAFFSPDRELFDVSRFLTFPITPRSLWLVHFLSTLFNMDVAWLYPSLLGLAFMPVVLRGPSALPSVLPVLLLALAALVWRNVLTTVLGGILKRRKLREVFVLLVSLLAILLQFYILTPGRTRGYGDRVGPWLGKAPEGVWGGVVRWNPAGIAARGAVAAVRHGWVAAAAACVAMAALALLGSAAGMRVLLRFYVEPPQEGGRLARKGRAAAQGWRLPLLPDRLVAIVEKEVKYLFRSTAGKWAILSSLVAFLLFVSAPRQAAVSMGRTLDPVSMRAIVLGGFFLLMAARLCGNLFAWDGHGLKSYLLAPVPGAYILLGKGLAYGLLAFLQFLLAAGTLALAFGKPTLSGFVGATAWYLSALGVVVSAGTVFSVLFPQAENIQKFQRREQALVGLLWFPLLGVAMMPGLGASFLAEAMGSPWMLAAIMTAWCGVLLAFYGLIVWWLSRELAQRGPDLLERITEQVA